MDVERRRHLHTGIVIAMGIFTDLEMVWDGKPYTIKSHRMMGALAQIEQFVTPTEIALFGQRQTMPLVRMCQAYAAVLRYAGGRVSEEDVFQAVQEDQAKQFAMFKQIMIFVALGRPKNERETIYQAIANAEQAVEAADQDQADDAAPAAIEADPGNLDAAAAPS